MFIPRTANNSNFSTDASDYLKFFCMSTSIPEISNDTIGANGHEMNGVIRQTAASVKFEKPFGMKVIERSDFIVYEQLREWFEKTSPGYNNYSNTNIRAGYYNDYTCDIILKKFEYDTDVSDQDPLMDKINQGKTTGEGFNEVMTVYFKNAHVNKIGSIQLATDSVNTFTSFDVSFYYETFHTVIKKDGDKPAVLR